MANCIITFDHFNAIYYSGQSLNGIIQLMTDSPKTIRGVHITINGYAKVQWSTTSTSHSKTYTAFDQYLNSRTYVAGQKNGGSFEFPSGMHDYTFNCELPLSLPSSVSGKYGEIKYEVILTIDRPFLIDNVYKREFTVMKEINPNLFPLLKTPIHATNEYEYRCKICCFGSPGIIKTKLSTPLRGYASGEKIYFSLEVANESENNLRQCKVKLVKCITFEAREPTEKEKNINSKLASKLFPQVLRQSTKTFEDSLFIPFVPPTSQSNDPCIRVNYILKAKINTGYFSKNITLAVPIVIDVKSAANTNSIITEQSTSVLPNSCSIAGGEELNKVK